MFVITVDDLKDIGDPWMYSSALEDNDSQTIVSAIQAATCGRFTDEECQKIAGELIERKWCWRHANWLFGLRVVAGPKGANQEKNVAAKVVGDKLAADGSFGSANLSCLNFRSEKDVTDLYSKYLDVYNRSYAESSAPGRSVFMAMPWEYVSALEFMPGDLVQSGKKYYAVDRLTMNGNKVVLLCVDSDGKEATLGAEEIEIASIPRRAVQAIREHVMRSLEKADDENKERG